MNRDLLRHAARCAGLLAVLTGLVYPRRAAAAGAAAPASGKATTAACEEAYSNLWTPPTYFYVAGAGVEVLDDLHLGPQPMGKLCAFDIGCHNAGVNVTTATVRFYANSALDGPPGPPLVTFTLPGLAPGSQVVHLDVPASVLPQDLWLGVSFDQADVGLLMAQPPWPGQSDDLFYERPAGVYRTFGGNPAANFMLGVTASPDVSDAGQEGFQRAGILTGPIPNPMTSESEVRFVLPSRGHVRAEVLDAQGRLVSTLADQPFAAGVHALVWTGASASGAHSAPGVYWLRLTLPGYAGVRKVTLLR